MPTTIETPPLFVDSTPDRAIPLSASAIAILRQNAIAVDGLAYRDLPLFDSMASNPSYDAHPSGDFILGRWRLRYQSGLTTLTITGTASGYTGGLSVYINGALAASVTLAGIWTQTVDISTGYAADDILLIDVYTSGNTNKTSKIVIHDVYATPVSLAGWPGVPTFSGQYTATKLNQLADACTWLHNRLNLVPMMPSVAHFWKNGRNDRNSSGSGAGIITQYTGSVINPCTNAILRIEGWANILTNLTERIKVYLGGSLVYTGPTWTPGSYGFSIPLSLSAVTIGTRVELRIQSEVLSVANNNGQDSRYSFTKLRTEAGGAGYPVQAPPSALLGVGPLYSATNVNTALNAIATMLNNTKTAIEANVSLTRIRAMRAIYGYDQHDWAKFTRPHPHVFFRRGDRLVVRGKNVSIGWGNLIQETDDNGNTTYKYKFANEQSIIDANKVETQTIYLDSLTGLFPGMPYYVFGDVIYAAEFLF